MATTCIIERNDKKRVSKVKTLSGEKSVLFDKIASIPLMENRERLYLCLKQCIPRSSKNFLETGLRIRL